MAKRAMLISKAFKIEDASLQPLSAGPLILPLPCNMRTPGFAVEIQHPSGRQAAIERYVEVHNTEPKPFKGINSARNSHRRTEYSECVRAMAVWPHQML